MENQVRKLKDRIIEKVGEMIDCIEMIGKTDYFELSIKHINGDIITKTEYSDKEKIK